MPTVFALVLCGTVVTGDKGLLLCALGCTDGLVAYDGRGHGDDEWRMPPENDRRSLRQRLLAVKTHNVVTERAATCVLCFSATRWSGSQSGCG